MANPTISEGIALAAIYVNGRCERPGVTARGEIIGHPGQVVGGQPRANRTDFKKMCQEYFVYCQRLPQIFDKFKEELEAPLLAEILRLKADKQQLLQKTVDQKGMLESSLEDSRKMQDAIEDVIKEGMEWQKEALNLRENFALSSEMVVSLREQVGRLQPSNTIHRDSHAGPSGLVPVAQPQLQGLPGLVKVEVSVALHPDGERMMVDQVEVPQDGPVELDEAAEEVPLVQQVGEPAAQQVEEPAAQQVEEPAAQQVEVPPVAQQVAQLAEVPARGRQVRRRREEAKGTTWKCPFKGCHKRLSNQDSLRYHKLHVHNKTKAILIPCTRQDCAKGFSKTSHRADHWRALHGDPKLSCPGCGKLFSAVSKFNKHKKDEHNL